MSEIKYQNAQKSQAADIADLIMTAMNDECCQYFYKPNHTANDFRNMMIRLVEREDSQYSYKNTIVAVEDDKVVGAAVSYDGSQLHDLQKAFLEATRRDLQRDFSSMQDETEPGELYLDSFAVVSGKRGHGIGSNLLKATMNKAKTMNIPNVGLLVDHGNPKAEKLYVANGFRFVNQNKWGGHAMKHLQKKI